MHDLRWVREHPEEFDRGLTRRGLSKRADEILELDRSWRAAETRAQEAQAQRNRLSREIGAAKSRGLDVQVLVDSQKATREAGLKLKLAEPVLCTDNATMIAYAAAERISRDYRSDFAEDADPNLSLI